ncbi:unnamed protein product [Pedinophyceae sp. YPF-701]|nr:unnamed protein product [Pedinophyceae sp. YPF-701]
MAVFSQAAPKAAAAAVAASVSGFPWTLLFAFVAVGALAAAAGAGVFFYCKHFVHVASPNEWLLVIRDGGQVRAGVGMRYVAGLTDNVVKFSSSIHKVSFRAQQVTAEMQGIEVAGFVMWTVFREGDGPFRAYRSLDGMSPAGLRTANQNLTNMAESIIRAEVASKTIRDVIAKRELIRDSCRSKMLEVVRGWGVWLETVEVTDVTILSRSLFENLQSDYRERIREEADKRRMATQEEIDGARIASDLRTAKARADATRARKVHEAQQRLEEQQQREALMEEERRIAMQELDNAHALKVHDNELKYAARKLEIEREIAVQRMQQDQALEHLRKKLEVEGSMTDVNLKKMAMDTTQAVYGCVGDLSVRVVHPGPGTGAVGLEGILPGLMTVSEALKATN